MGGVKLFLLLALTCGLAHGQQGAPPCPFPALPLFLSATKTACVGRVLARVTSVEEGQALCRAAYPSATVTTLYFEASSQTTPTAAVQAHYAALGYKNERLLVAADSSSGGWVWTRPRDTTNVPPVQEMAPALVAGLPTASQGFPLLFMNSDRSFALEAAPAGTTFDGAMCSFVDLRQ